MGNLFSWGGKGGGGDAPPPMSAMPQQDNTAMYMEMMGGMMEGLMGMAASQQASSQMMMDMQMPQMPTMPQAPLPERALEIDWTEKQDQLTAKTKADYGVDQARRKNRTGTVLTSPLLDDEDATTTGSVLAGGNQQVGNQ